MAVTKKMKTISTKKTTKTRKKEPWAGNEMDGEIRAQLLAAQKSLKNARTPADKKEKARIDKQIEAFKKKYGKI